MSTNKNTIKNPFLIFRDNTKLALGFICVCFTGEFTLGLQRTVFDDELTLPLFLNLEL